MGSGREHHYRYVLQHSVGAAGDGVLGPTGSAPFARWLRGPTVAGCVARHRRRCGPLPAGGCLEAAEDVLEVAGDVDGGAVFQVWGDDLDPDG